jgi:hypothetical protein
MRAIGYSVMNQLSHQVQSAIDALSRCSTACLISAMTHCLESDGRDGRPQHIRLLLDCASTCDYASSALARKSQFHNRIAALSADVCDTCALDCEALGGLDECATAARQASVLCREIAKAGHAEVLDMASRLSPE